MDSKPQSEQLNQNLDTVVRQLEMRQANLRTSVQFEKNMRFFEQQNPSIFQHYANYTPEELKLSYSEAGYINVVNSKLDNKPVFEQNPEEHAKGFVNEFKQAPKFYRISARNQSVLGGEDDVHITAMKKVVHAIHHSEEIVIGRKLQEHTNFVLMTGLGLGYQINELLAVTDVHHLIIMEPHEDLFYASMHTVDWQEIHAHFNQPNHSLSYIVGQSTFKGFDTLRVHLNRIGLHNAIQPFIFNYLSSTELNESAKVFVERMPSMVTALGYLDDEQTSIAHTVNNVRKNIPLMVDHVRLNKKRLDKPAFVIGNGPSLDKAKDFLLENQHKAIIFSCGTAIGSLKKLGIKPDFHVELERTRPIVEWVEEATDEEYRKDVIFLGINTVPPDCFDLFEECGLAMKSNDLGSHYISKLLTGDKYLVSLSHCNPTVSNTGFAFAQSLGFNDIYLIGMDFGFSAGDQHHSSLSIHYDVKDEHVEDLNLITNKSRETNRVDANFGGKVESTVVYNSSRHTIEALINIEKDIHVFNTAEGALIRGAEPVRYGDIELGDNFDTLAYSQDLHKRFFKRMSLNMGSDKKIQKDFDHTINLCKTLSSLFTEEPSTINEAFALLDKQHAIAIQTGLNKATQYSYSLIKGSIHAFDLALAKCLFNTSTEEKSVALFNEAKECYREFLEAAQIKIRDKLLENDKRDRQLKKIMK